jgi:hypothetical protein
LIVFDSKLVELTELQRSYIQQLRDTERLTNKPELLVPGDNEEHSITCSTCDITLYSDYKIVNRNNKYQYIPHRDEVIISDHKTRLLIKC